MSTHRAELRAELRSRRRALTAEQQKAAGIGVCNILIESGVLGNCRHIALYLANDGEIDPLQLQRYLWRENKNCYLPALVDDHKMVFVEYRPDTQLVVNCFGIREPARHGAAVLASEQLDLILLPLTGFDLSGGRLGMGGGFYDRALANNGEQPILIGLAHECQKVDEIPTEYWDVPLAGVATDRCFYAFSKISPTKK